MWGAESDHQMRLCPQRDFEYRSYLIMAELSESFLRELMEETDGDDMALAGILLSDSNEAVGPSLVSGSTTDEKIQRLEMQLEEQKKLLSSMMGKNGHAASSKRGANVSTSEKRKNNRARLKREQEAMEREMELKAKALLVTYERALEQNKMLKQRLELLESSVRLREETLEALSKSKG